MDTSEPPPPYQKEPPAGHGARLQVNDGIPPDVRRSMEDETRTLPKGWVRQYDANNSHQFFVDTRADPPRSIWQHPYDDEQYLNTLSSEERERLQTMYDRPHEDLPSDSAQGQGHASPSKMTGPSVGGNANVGPSTSSNPEVQRPQKVSVGRKWKDKLTNSTHEEREARRAQEAEEERKAYEQHRALRIAMNKALETGQPQLIGKDRQGHDVYIEPPRGPGSTVYGYPGSGPNYRGYNPFQQGPYTNPNARFMRPAGPYGRPGYGGMGMPLAGGMMGGLMLGGLLGAGF